MPKMIEITGNQFHLSDVLYIVVRNIGEKDAKVVAAFVEKEKAQDYIEEFDGSDNKLTMHLSISSK